jgi:LacI family transcriptional regulator
MPARLKDIAKELGVSVVTVSKALRDIPGISRDTRARVLKVAKKLNYGPNLAARGLVTGRTFTVGLVIPEMVHPFFAQIAKSIGIVVHARGYSLVVSSSEENPDIEKQAVERLVARSVDCLLIASTQRSFEIFKWVTQQGIPYVLIDRKFEGRTANFVGVDDITMGTLATEHLIAMGCRKIAHIGGTRLSSAAGRKKGYELTLARHNMTVDPRYVVLEEHVDTPANETGYESAKTLLRLSPRPDAMFCYNDSVAMGALMACLDAGLRIPEDVAFVGCGNSHFDDFLRVPLSSIDQKSEAIGQHAGELALRLIESKKAITKQTVLLTPELIVRKSSQKPTGRQ